MPEFTSVAVNDGMGLVTTELDARDLTAERIARFFARINAHAASHPLDANRYSLSVPDLRAAALEGGRSVLGRYGLAPRVLERMEGGARIPVPGGAEAWTQAVPGWLRESPLGRSEMGLNFGGNHFLEIQVVESHIGTPTAAHFGLERNQVVIMYHLGPGPFGGTLLHHYSRRENLDVSNEEFEREIGRYAERTGRTPAAVRARLEKEGGLSRVSAGLRREKSIDFLMARATISGA